MANDTHQTVLPDLQRFLQELKLVPENQVPFHAHWVSWFLRFARGRDISLDEYYEGAMIEFLDELCMDEKILDWQHRQAEHALRLYYFHYLGISGAPTAQGVKPADIEGTLREMTRLIRLKHFSYSTERTYLQWAERFFVYAFQAGKKRPSDTTAEDFRNFLSHLALRQNVSSSTQNQAFNAILFLFRHVLGKETGDLGDTVRAKRGTKLPTVLSVDEVKRLFAHMSGTSLLIAELLYGAGMRLMEVTRLRVRDIDFETSTVFVRSGKGDKDRSTSCMGIVRNQVAEVVDALNGSRTDQGQELLVRLSLPPSRSS